MTTPFVSVVIVNYNGAHYLSTCLDALRNQTYPSDRFEVIVSDNGSTDGSLELLEGSYPWVRLFDNHENFGFALGNNVAIRQTEGEFVVLLNNDTAPTPNWLTEMVAVAKQHPEAGLVTGHLHLFYPQIDISIRVEPNLPDSGNHQLGVKVFSVDSGVNRGVVQYLDGFTGAEGHLSGENFRRLRQEAVLGVPVPPGDEAWELKLRLSSSIEHTIRMKAGDINLLEINVEEDEPHEYLISVPAESRKYALPVEQNTGSIIFWNGSGRDRGTYVRGTDVLYESDNGQYSELEEVFSGCGASLLIRRSMLTDIGPFDDDFFMYYEDTDLSWRAWLMGWKVLYAPKAVCQHIHCGTTKEWSPYFVFLTERNRLAMVFKNGTRRQVFHVWSRYFMHFLKTSFQGMKMLFARQPTWRSHSKSILVHLKIISALLIWLPSLLRKRLRIQRQAKIKPDKLITWFVE